MNAIRFAKCISTTLAVSFAAGSLAGGELPSAAGGKPGRDSYVECWGVDARDYGRSFRSDGRIEFAQVVSPSPPALNLSQNQGLF